MPPSAFTLKEQYRRAMRSYRAAVERMESATGAEIELAHRSVEEARLEFERLREQLRSSENSSNPGQP
jgi:hypothetical protein